MIKKLFILVFIFFLLSGCLSTTDLTSEKPETDSEPETTNTITVKDSLENLSLDSLLVIARKNAQSNTSGGSVLKTAVDMIEQKIIVIGSCWDYINQVYETAGFPGSKREDIFRGSKEGPLADPALIQPGDWIYFKNLPYGEISHSAIFVEWIDFDRRSALTIEYIGRDRDVPGWFREADITKVYSIFRGVE